MGLVLALLCASPLSTRELAELHDASFRQFNSIQARIEVLEARIDAGNSVAEPKLSKRMDWNWANGSERIAITTYFIDEKTKQPRTKLDVYANTPNGSQSMNCPNADSGLHPTRTDAKGIAAVIGPRDPKDYAGPVPILTWPWLRFAVLDKNRSAMQLVSLAELLGGAKQARILEETPERCVLFVESNFGRDQPLTLTYEFSKAHSFMTRSVSNPQGDKGEVTKWQVVGGVPFPKQIKSTVKTARGTLVSLWNFEDVKINDSPGAPAFSIDFPEWTVVHERGTGKVFVWGKGSPQLTFESGADYQTWLEQQRLEQGHLNVQALAEAVSAPSWPWWVWVGGGAILLLLAFLVQRRRRQAV